MTETDLLLDKLSTDEEIMSLPTPQTTIEVAKLISAIEAIKRRQHLARVQLTDAARFYQDKVDKGESQISFVKSLIMGYLNANGISNLSTHKGTAFRGSRNAYAWTNIDKITEWAKENKCGELVFKLDKQKVINLVKLGGLVPEGLTIVETEYLGIRGRNDEPGFVTD